MGFLTAAGLSCVASASASSSATLTFPGNVKDGCVLFAMFVGNTNPANAWSTPTGWTLLVAQKNGASSFGGRFAIFYKVWRNGDSLSVTSTLAANTQWSAVGLAVTSDTDGASVQIGNPPSGGFTTGYDSEMTAATTTATIPRLQVDETAWDLRLVFFAHPSTNPTITPATPAQSASNLFRAGASQVAAVTSAPFAGIYYQFATDVSGSDAGTTSWTQTSNKSYVVGVVLGESGASSGIDAGTEVGFNECETALEVVGLDEIVILTQGGGGGSITVF